MNLKIYNENINFFRLSAARKTGWTPNRVTPSPRSSSTTTPTPDPVTAERNVNPRFWMDERSVDTLSQKLTVPLQLQLDSVSDGLKEEYRNLLGSLRMTCIYIYLLKAVGLAGFYRFFVFTILRKKNIIIGCIKALEWASSSSLSSLACRTTGAGLCQPQPRGLCHLLSHTAGLHGP
jgi:hypothetical protein